jgi:hypothetical protein
VKQTDIRDLFKKATKRICIVVVPPDSLFPAPSTSSLVKTPENTEEDSDDPEQAAEGAFPMEYSSD